MRIGVNTGQKQSHVHSPILVTTKILMPFMEQQIHELRTHCDEKKTCLGIKRTNLQQTCDQTSNRYGSKGTHWTINTRHLTSTVWCSKGTGCLGFPFIRQNRLMVAKRWKERAAFEGPRELDQRDIGLISTVRLPCRRAPRTPGIYLLGLRE